MEYSISKEKPKCFHKYLTVCKTDYLSPGFGDWLRGTVTLWEFCKKYDFDFYIDKDIHPIFSYLQDHETLTMDPLPDRNVEECYYPTPYDEIDKLLESLFEKKETFAVLTNGLYVPISKEITDYYGHITEECKRWLRPILTPNQYLQESIDNVYSILDIDITKPYRVIHLRLGDNFLHQNNFDQYYYKSINERIAHTLNTESEFQYILLCDTSSFGIALNVDNPSLRYWDNKKIHTGELQYDKNKIGVKDTLIDFFIMSKATHILSLFDSGFSKMISFIYDITYYRI
jgi:hypothetical protein